MLEDEEYWRRFWTHVDKSGDCWLWTGQVQYRGYGMYTRRHGTKLVHRILYIQTHGPIPEGIVLDHLCHTADDTCQLNKQCLHRRCVNPAHLEAVTFQENVKRGRTATKTHCKHGHEFSVQNTYVYTDKRGYTYRQCKACIADAGRRRRARI